MTGYEVSVVRHRRATAGTPPEIIAMAQCRGGRGAALRPAPVANVSGHGAEPVDVVEFAARIDREIDKISKVLASRGASQIL